MSNLRVISLLRSHVSWAKVGREIVNDLARRDIDVSAEEVLDGPYLENFHLEPNVENALRRGLPRVAYKANLALTSPLEYDSVFQPLAMRLGLLVFETAVWPAQWVNYAERFLDVAVVPSTFCRDGLVQCGLSPQKVQVIPHGVNDDIYNDDGRRVWRIDGKLRILFVGTPARRKGLDILADAIGNLPSRLARDVHVTIKTSIWSKRADFLDMEEISTRFASSSASFNIDYSMLDENDMADMYRQHDVLCLPHCGEGFGLPVLEAMACGTVPVVTLSTGVLDFFDAACGFALHPSVEVSCVHDYFPASFRMASAGSMFRPSVADLTDALAYTISTVSSAEALKLRAICNSKARKFTWSLANDRLMEII